jgi:hypothetical protein
MLDRSPLQRQWLLLRTLSARKRGCTVTELSRDLEVSDKTIRRDLLVLRRVGFPLAEVKRRTRPKMVESIQLRDSARIGIHFRRSLGNLSGSALLRAASWDDVSGSVRTSNRESDLPPWVIPVPKLEPNSFDVLVEPEAGAQRKPTDQSKSPRGLEADIRGNCAASACCTFSATATHLLIASDPPSTRNPCCARFLRSWSAIWLMSRELNKPPATQKMQRQRSVSCDERVVLIASRVTTRNAPARTNQPSSGSSRLPPNASRPRSHGLDRRRRA